MNGASVKLIFLAHWNCHEVAVPPEWSSPCSTLPTSYVNTYSSANLIFAYSILFHIHMNAPTYLGDNQIVEILIIIWLAFYRLLARTRGCGLFNTQELWQGGFQIDLYPLFSRLRCQTNAALPR